VPSDVDRLVALVRRELGASSVEIREPGEAGHGRRERELTCALSGGRVLVAIFAKRPADADALQRRLEMLAGTFDALVAPASGDRTSRPPVARSLRDELTALCSRAGASNAVVIDANSPVIWGAARPEGSKQEPGASSARMAELSQLEEVGPTPEVGAIAPQVPPAGAAEKAAREVRSLPEIAALRKGKRLRQVRNGVEVPWIAHSFAGIYLLVLVFDGSFDELRAERAILESIARVERLVLALPPMDPEPGARGGVVRVRRSRRR
jgi:hypothetical protein